MSILRRALLKILRRVSPDWRAYTDLLVEPYQSWVGWQSGLGDAAHILYAITRTMKPQTIVEIGSARGRSSCIFALACLHNKSGHVYAIDPHGTNDWSDIGTRGTTDNFQRERLADYALSDRCTVMVSTSQDAAKDWVRPIDLLFIDGDHSYAAVSHDFHAFHPFLTPDALVLFHDSGWEHNGRWEDHRGENYYRPDMGVPAFLANLQRDGYHSVTLPTLPGLTILDPRRNGFEFVSHPESGSEQRQ
jgi:predicted O-methyltransferase YrrM